MMVTKDVNQGARIARQGATQFRSNIKTMKGWMEEQAEKYDSIRIFALCTSEMNSSSF